MTMPDALREAEAKLEVLAAELEQRVAEVEARLATPPSIEPRDHAARLQRAYDGLEEQARSSQTASATWQPRVSARQVRGKVDAAIAAMEDRIAAVVERAGRLEGAVATWHARAEAAVRDGDDDAARYALRARAAAADAAEKTRAEVQICRDAVEAWRELATR